MTFQQSVKISKRQWHRYYLGSSALCWRFKSKSKEWNIDYAVGCTYKYLNAGPGSPAFIYVNPKKINEVKPSLMGWLGHQKPFEFLHKYVPGKGINRMKIGTPPRSG